MGAIRLLARGELRRQWKAIVALTLLVGVIGAVVLASVAGARRTASALDRFRESTLAADLEINVGDVTADQLRAIRGAKGVAGVAELRQLALIPVRTGDLAIGGAVDTRFERIVDRARVLRGRHADPSAPLEIEIGENLAAELGLDVGDHLEFVSFTPEQLADPNIADAEFDPRGPAVSLDVVGIVRRPLDLGSRGAAGGVVVPTPAFVRDYRDRIGTWGGSILRVRLDDAARDLPRVVAASRRIFGVSAQEPLSIETEGARDAIDVLTVALWAFAGVAALAGVVTVGIVLSRSIGQTAVDQPTLRALGLGRRRRAAAAGATAVPIAAGGAVLAVLGATLLSPRFPMGVARRAEPDPGVVVDGPVLVIGVTMLAAVVLAIAVVSAWRTTRRGAFEGGDGLATRSSTTGRVAAGFGLSPSATAGLRMALEPGLGRTAVPVRSALIGAVVGVIGVVAIVTFAASLDTLVTTPSLWGATSDVQVSDNRATRDGAGDCGPASTRLTREPALDSVAVVCRLGVLLGGRATTAYGFTGLSGDLEPVAVVAGRAPRRSDEVAFGASTLDALGKEIGDTARVTGATPKAIRYRIVGKVVFPTYGPPQPLASGAAFTGAGLARLEDPDDANGDWFLLGRLAPGVERAAAVRTIKRMPGIEDAGTATLPVEIDRVRQVDQLPIVLAAFLALLAVAAVGHALVTAVRRRRRDLAILRTLGFSRGQVRATVAWQATTLALVGLVFGIPLGILVGRAVWRVVADGLGVSTTATVPALAVLLIVPAAIVLANLIALLPARAAARTRPAVVLRSE